MLLKVFALNFEEFSILLKEGKKENKICLFADFIFPGKEGLFTPKNTEKPEKCTKNKKGRPACGLPKKQNKS